MQGMDSTELRPPVGESRPAQRPTTRERWIYVVGTVSEVETDPPVRRRAPRYDLVYGSTLVRFRHPTNGRLIERTCNVLEVSNTGLMLRSREEIPPRTRVDLEACVGDELVFIHGAVMHCTTSVGAFKVGISLDFPA